MITLSHLAAHLDSLLNTHAFPDSAFNGLQVQTKNGEIRKIGFAVDAGESVIHKAVAERCDFLIVHHGLLWGDCQPLTGAFGRKIDYLFSNGCSLYGSHLPLDAHPELGNNFELARFLGLSALEPYFEHRGVSIGVRGRLDKPAEIADLEKRLSAIRKHGSSLTLPFGKTAISSVGIITGAAAFGIDQAHRAGLDLFITGEPKQAVYHQCKELELSAIFAGHYATETFGVRALQKHLTSKFDVQGVFIDEETGI